MRELVEPRVHGDTRQKLRHLAQCVVQVGERQRLHRSGSARVLLDQALTVLHLADTREAGVRRGAVQERGERTAPGELFRSLEQSEKHVLHDILCVGIAAHQAPRATKHRRSVASIDLVERVVVRGQDVSDYSEIPKSRTPSVTVIGLVCGSTRLYSTPIT